MLFENGSGHNNSGYASANVSTRIKTFCSDISSLTVAYWNENLSIMIKPLVNISPDGIRQYDNNRKAITAIPLTRAIALCKGIEEIIIPELKANSQNAKSVSVRMEKSRYIVAVEYKPNKDGVMSIFVTIYTQFELDSNKAVPGSSFTYEFQKSLIEVDYNPETGESVYLSVESEFEFFYQKLKAIVEAVGPTGAHGAEYNSAVSSGGNSGYFRNNSSYNNAMNNQNTFENPFTNSSSSSNNEPAALTTTNSSNFLLD